MSACFGPVPAERGVVLVGQRAAGYSQRALNCAFLGLAPPARVGGSIAPGVKPGEHPLVLGRQTGQLIECGRQLRAQGIDRGARR